MITAPVLALICLIISVVFAVIGNDIRSSSLWALWAIAVALIAGGLIGTAG